jgi:hypothetical protein
VNVLICLTRFAGGFARERSTAFEQAGTRVWAAVGRLLFVRIEGDRLEVTPFTVASADGPLEPLVVRGPDNRPIPTPLVIE